MRTFDTVASRAKIQQIKSALLTGPMNLFVLADSVLLTPRYLKLYMDHLISLNIVHISNEQKQLYGEGLIRQTPIFTLGAGKIVKQTNTHKPRLKREAGMHFVEDDSDEMPTTNDSIRREKILSSIVPFRDKLTLAFYGSYIAQDNHAAKD